MSPSPVRLFVVDLTYVAPVEAVDRHLPAHLEHLDRGYRDGAFLVSGRKQPRHGGVVVALGRNLASVEARVQADPFVVAGVAEASVTEVVPGRWRPELDRHLDGAEPGASRARSPRPSRHVTWQRLDGHGTGAMSLTPAAHGWALDVDEVVALATGSYRCAYSVRVDRDWRTIEAVVDVRSAQGRGHVHLQHDGDGTWTVDGRERPDLEGCVDVDVASTPATNTLPIRRNATLAEGASVTSRVAWVDVPSLEVHPVHQRYTRGTTVAGGTSGRWTYGDEAHGTHELEVDHDGVVTHYSGFATMLDRQGAARRVQRVAVDDPAVQRMVEALTAELAPFYTAEQTFGVPVDQLAASGVELFGAFEADRLVAIGGLGVDEQGAEVKRFYVEPDRRGSGAADVVLHAVIARARELGHGVLRLETGDQQHAAMRFYERRGFVPIDRFGPYVESETSRCYALHLTDGPAESATPQP